MAHKGHDERTRVSERERIRGRPRFSLSPIVKHTLAYTEGEANPKEGHRNPSSLFLSRSRPFNEGFSRRSLPPVFVAVADEARKREPLFPSLCFSMVRVTGTMQVVVAIVLVDQKYNSTGRFYGACGGGEME